MRERRQYGAESIDAVACGAESLGEGLRRKIAAEIVNNISNVSAVSQEVAAQATATYEEAAKNLLVVEDMMEIVNRLNESAEIINNF